MLKMDASSSKPKHSVTLKMDPFQVINGISDFGSQSQETCQTLYDVKRVRSPPITTSDATNLEFRTELSQLTEIEPDFCPVITDVRSLHLAIGQNGSCSKIPLTSSQTVADSPSFDLKNEQFTIPQKSLDSEDNHCIIQISSNVALNWNQTVAELDDMRNRWAGPVLEISPLILKSEIQCEPLTETFDTVAVKQKAIPDVPCVDVSALTPSWTETFEHVTVKQEVIAGVPDVDLNGVPDGVDAVPDGLDGVLDGVDGVPDGVDDVPDGIESVDCVPDGVDGVPDCVDCVPDGVDGVPAGVDSVTDGVDGVPDGVDSVPDDAKAVPDDVKLVFEYYCGNPGEDNLWEERVLEENLFNLSQNIKPGTESLNFNTKNHKKTSRSKSSISKIETVTVMVKFPSNRNGQGQISLKSPNSRSQYTRKVKNSNKDILNCEIQTRLAIGTKVKSTNPLKTDGILNNKSNRKRKIASKEIETRQKAEIDFSESEPIYRPTGETNPKNFQRRANDETDFCEDTAGKKYNFPENESFDKIGKGENEEIGENKYFENTLKFYGLDRTRGNVGMTSDSAEKESVKKTIDKSEKLGTQSNSVEFPTTVTNGVKKPHKKIRKLLKNETCSKCDKVFTSRKSFKDHLIRHDRSKKYSCVVCKSKFSDPNYLKEHLLQHKYNTAFRCDICSKNYSSKGCLRKHKQQQHSDSKPFECDICGNMFPRKYNLERHLLTHLLRHSKDLQFKCDQCDKCFTSKNALELHRSSIHATEKPFKCTKCEKRFAIKSRLSAHFRLHTLPFQCHICSHRFSTLSGLEGHLSVHTGLKSYQCNICEDSFKLKWQLTKHKRINHDSE